MRHVIVAVCAVVAVVAVAPVADAQWFKYPDKGIPRASNGQPDFSAPAPRTPDGRPDLSGRWGLVANHTTSTSWPT